ncbi:M24 family metallopeptidase [Anaeromyxobacter oryzae]|uniref:Peptidase M24 n=1 Tax=Anaeromyxobacter oryzae TaxID=2918170 RepID=A0ABM7WV47_9BACT|nr:M24 family metallopeptidase [Anaeromyxobacter oryzae]BDG03368.1 peptidase M24 [Anaeromyxobacter oryzae]
MDIPALQRALAEQDLDAWLLYDFHGQNPTAVNALGLAGHMLTRRWFYLVPRSGVPVALVHAIEIGSFPKDVPGERRRYASWQSLRAELGSLLGRLRPRARIAMEYCPEGAIPYLSRVDAGTLELVRTYGVDVVSSAELVQLFLCRWDAEQVESHRRALAGIDAAKDAAFARIGEAQRRGETILETDVQRFLMERFAADGLEADHPPIVAVNGHAGDPHYEPSDATPTPIRRGDLVLIDLWARATGPRDVYADITWVGFCGDDPPPKLQEIFRVTTGARDVGLATVERAARAGEVLEGWQVDRAVRDFIASHGYGERFVHRTGHSIDTRVHGDGANLDDLETHDTRRLVPGLAFSIEPGIYLPEEGLGVRSEIDVFLAADGPKVFGKIQRELVRI